ncbi:uncharacterized protein PHACADRAFT_254025 [Phanerochaete carnosa HHB-10118-sp]|uniref:Ricin B lectin domain-containing protein n=1 Tax=Phanerochaete carnosa (strain HHB-10118-sp) TaxID=650164 RepID=K5V2H6_PHACS|nr:uncharacterized protein PHACADRAFT_254025 [Phanerochaete carnosa HHB-10118-sp]EKM56731.1 hypothetical protein PHACADRAFT_254025 [Phanerochaete carnosa HHB-10118-sp]
MLRAVPRPPLPPLRTNYSDAGSMLVTPDTTNPPTIREGVYEIKDSVSGQYLNSVEASVYNRLCDDVLVLQDRASRYGKWEISRVGQGYTIKQVSSGLYCAIADGDQLQSQTVVLCPVPTVWVITFTDHTTQAVRVAWSISNYCWDTPPSGQGRLVSLGKVPNDPAKAAAFVTWYLESVGPNHNLGPIPPGVYALQNQASGTYVSLSPDNKTVSCWPEIKLEKTGVRLWEILPLGDGYSIKLHSTDKYATLQSGMGYRSKVTVSKLPAAWRIVPADSPLLANEGYVQIFWSDTEICWDLSGYGRKAAGTPVEVMFNKDYQACRLFKLL